jgi:putative ABC transport system ATP-binding protein
VVSTETGTSTSDRAAPAGHTANGRLGQPDGVLLEARDLHRSWGSGANAVAAVAGISLSVQTGEVLALMGPSGCGKSTLLGLLGGLDTPDRGSVRIAGKDWQSFPARAQARFRRETCGYVFQSLALLPAATAAENVETPLLLAGVGAAERRERVAAALAQVGMASSGAHLPDQLSGGEQQRIGIARALVHRPALVLADEPTGSLDSHTADDITRVLVDTARQQNTTVVLVTHDPRVAMHADRVLYLHSGRLDGTRETAPADPATAPLGGRA